MKWNKYPETKPVEGSGKTLNGCLLYLKIPQYDYEGYHPEDRNGWAIRLGVYHNGTWNQPRSEIEPYPERFQEAITHYLYLIDIPGPSDENE